MDQLADAAEMDKQVILVQDTMGPTNHTSQPHFEHNKASCNATQPSSNPEAVQDNVPPFLKTPLEIRNQIYGYLLSTKYTKADFRDEEPGYLPGWRYHHGHLYHFHPAILAVNRQFNHEAGQILRENLFVKLITDTCVDADGEFLPGDILPIVAHDCLASRVRYHAMELTLTSDAESPEHPYWICMLAGDDVTEVCRVLLRSGEFNRPKNSLSIAIIGAAPAVTSILKLMEPFRRLYSIAPVKVTGKIEAKYRSDLIARISRRAWDGYTDFDAHLQEYQDTIEQGDQAATNKEFPTAIARYKRALEEGDDFCHIHTVVADKIILQSENFRGHTFEEAFIQIKFALKYKLAVIYLNLGNHKRAHEWISLAVEDIYYLLDKIEHFGRSLYAVPSSVSDSTIAAQVSEGLELAERAVEEMKEEAEAQCDPGDLDLAEKQERLEMALGGVKKLLQVGDGGL